MSWADLAQEEIVKKTLSSPEWWLMRSAFPRFFLIQHTFDAEWGT